MEDLIDYTEEARNGIQCAASICSQGRGKYFRAIWKAGRGLYGVLFADLSVECTGPNDEAYVHQTWQGKAMYTTAELRKAGFNFKKPDLFVL